MNFPKKFRGIPIIDEDKLGGPRGYSVVTALISAMAVAHPSHDRHKPGCQLVPVGVKPAVGRNQTCPCGAGRKFKKCCGMSM